MKVCTNCGEVNNRESLSCINCNSSNKFFVEYNEEIINSQNNIIKKNKIKRNIITTFFTGSILLFVLLIFLNFSNKTFSFNLIFKTLLFIVVGTVLMKFTEEVFVLTHIFSMSDINRNQMSDMYDTYVKVIGGIFIFLSLIALIKPLIL